MWYLLSLLLATAAMVWVDTLSDFLVMLGAGLSGLFMATAVYEPRIREALEKAAAADMEDRNE